LREASEPGIRRPRRSASRRRPWACRRLIGVRLAECPTRFADGLIGDDDPTGEQEFFDLVIAEAEPEIEPNGVADDLDREAVVLIAADRWWVHPPNMAHQVSARQAAQQVDIYGPAAGVKGRSSCDTKEGRCRHISGL
jgi:hypothetical protein